MPKIKQDNAQVKALEQIAAGLAEAERLNSILSGETECFLATEAGKKMQRVDILDKDKPKILAMVAAKKAKLAKDIRSNAEKFRIELDAKEEAILADKATAAEAKSAALEEDTPELVIDSNN